MKSLPIIALSITCLFIGSVTADISEYFLRDPYDQLDLFRRSKLASRRQSGGEKSTDNTEIDDKKEEEELDDDELVEDYLDYLLDVGALPSEDQKAEESKAKEEESKKLRPRKGPYEVGDDVLAAVKQPYNNRRMGSYKKKPQRGGGNFKQQQQIRDNIALESSVSSAAPAAVIRRRSKPQYAKPQMLRRSDEAKKPFHKKQGPPSSSRDLPGLENVERLIPSSLKTVIEDSGKRIVKAVMQPIQTVTNSRPRNTHIKETTFSSKMESWLQPYRTYFGYMAPTFAPAHITTFLVTQWVSTIAITFAWITVGYMYNTMVTGRSNEGRSSQEPWEYLVPDSDTVSTVLHDLSEAAQRWHDEL